MKLTLKLQFCRYGRVNYVLARRLDLLKEVQRLQVSLMKTLPIFVCLFVSHVLILFTIIILRSVEDK